MNILVCIKRVPSPGTRINLTDDQRSIDTKNLGFAISPHEECALEEAVQIKENIGGKVTALTLGPEDAIQQLRQAIAIGADDALLLKTNGEDWDPMATSKAIADKIKDMDFDLILFGNESADSGGYQVGIRVAHALQLPSITGVRQLDIEGDEVLAQREAGSGREVYKLKLPAIIGVKEGINLPRYPSLPGRMRANRTPVPDSIPEKNLGGPELSKLHVPKEQGSNVEILGEGNIAIERVVEILKEIKIVT